MATQEWCFWSPEFQLQFARHGLGAHVKLANHAVIQIEEGPGEFVLVVATRFSIQIEMRFSGTKAGTRITIDRCSMLAAAFDSNPARPVLLVVYGRIPEYGEWHHLVGTYNLKGQQKGLFRILDTK